MNGAQKLGLNQTTLKRFTASMHRDSSAPRDMALLGKALIHDVPDEYAIHKEKEFPSIRSASRTVTACCGATLTWTG
jgi:D-alanyl-D-alanine carboxypeptidase (penicillin-binding protein 5/6)